MGKRRAKAKPAAKKKYALPKTFDCPYCDHTGAVDIKMNYMKGHARLACGACGVNFQKPISTLDEPIDVYHDWIDQAAAVQDPDLPARAAASVRTGSDDGGDAGPYGEDDDDGFLVRDPHEEDEAADFRA